MNTQTLKPGYLVMGVTFLGADAVWGLDALDAGFTDTDQFGPILVIVLGVLGVAASVRALRRPEVRHHPVQEDVQ